MGKQTTPRHDEYLIWWLNQPACESAVNSVNRKETKLPPYIKSELKSAYGRAGRGRLWVPSSINCEGIKWKSEHPNAEYCAHSAGIVFFEKDLDSVSSAECGLVTRLDMAVTVKDFCKK